MEKRKTKILLVIGGHAWQQGSPEPLLSTIKKLGLSDVEIRSVPYHGYREFGTMTGAIATIVKAIDKCSKEGYKPFLIGNSAGGHLAMCAARIRQKEISGVISIAGALDFDNIPQMNNIFLKFLLRGLNPMTWASEIKIPMLLVHGSKDSMVYPNSSTRFYNAATHCHKKYIKFIPEIGHDVSVITAAKKELENFLFNI